ncbi:hypothetical protein [Bacillus sp. AK128]
MNSERKQIIIKEIEYWKTNRLLPEQYCNYLLTLYSEGEHVDQETKRARFGKFFSSMLPTSCLLFILVALLATYFTEMSIHLQITINVSLLAITSLFTWYYRNKTSFYFKIYIILSFLLFFITTIEVVDFYVKGNPLTLGTLVFSHCLLWYVAGRKLQLTYLKVAGVSGLVILIVFLIKDIFLT